MPFTAEHPLQPFWTMAATPLQVQALEQAVAHDLFGTLTRPLPAATVAQQLGLHPVATGVWLDLLWSMQLLVRHAPVASSAAPEYVASPLAQRFFVKTSPEYCAQAWLYRAGFLARFAGQWATLLQAGVEGQSNEAAPTGSWAQAARAQIGQEQQAVTVPAVLRLLGTLPPLPAQGRLLDLGGGPGHVGIALAQQLPDWQGVVCDQPETADVARTNIQQAGLSDRMEARGCDLNSDSIGKGYDLIWCSSVLHFLHDPQDAICTMLDALNPGGLLVLAHAELPDDAAQAARVMPFYGSLVLRGHYLPHAGAIARMLDAAGFTDIRSLDTIDFPMAPVWVHMGRKR